VALNMAFSGSDFADANPLLTAPAPLSKDTHAAVGQQLSFSGGGSTLNPIANDLLTLARAGKIDLIAAQADHGYVFDAATDRFMGDANNVALTTSALLALSGVNTQQTWTAVPAGLGLRLGIDRDGDGVKNATEIAQGSDPSDPASKQIQPAQGMWYNPARSGHGFDVQFAGSNLFVTWFTYQDDGSPTWYVAVAPYARPWRAPMSRVVWDPIAGHAIVTEVGQMTMNFTGARAGRVDWQIANRSGSEPLQPLIGAPTPLLDRTGNWYDATQPGWGMGVYTAGDVFFAIAYFYDSNNQPRWVVGQSENQARVTLQMQSARGFCPDCAAKPLILSPAGEVRYEFNGTRAASAYVDVFDSASPNAHWQRGPVVLTPLTTPVLHPEAF
jgi:hypothetical protein